MFDPFRVGGYVWSFFYKCVTPSGSMLLKSGAGLESRYLSLGISSRGNALRQAQGPPFDRLRDHPFFVGHPAFNAGIEYRHLSSVISSFGNTLFCWSSRSVHDLQKLSKYVFYDKKCYINRINSELIS